MIADAASLQKGPHTQSLDGRQRIAISEGSGTDQPKLRKLIAQDLKKETKTENCVSLALGAERQISEKSLRKNNTKIKTKLRETLPKPNPSERTIKAIRLCECGKQEQSL